MRNKERIPIILKEIENIWNKYPDLRLGQLICNVVTDPMLYYIEDDLLIEGLKEMYSLDEKGDNKDGYKEINK